MAWYFHFLKNLPQYVVVHAAKGFCIGYETDVDIFRDIPCFFYDPVGVGNLISGSSTFSKSSLYI